MHFRAPVRPKGRSGEAVNQLKETGHIQSKMERISEFPEHTHAEYQEDSEDLLAKLSKGRAYRC